MTTPPPMLLWPSTPPPAEPEPGAERWAVMPGDAVALHHFLLASTGSREQRDEILDRLAELVARPLDELHVAIGPVSPAGGVWVGVAEPDAVAAALADWQGLGLEPDRLVPAPLLLDPVADTGAPTLARLGSLVVVRAAERAAAVEPELALALLPEGAAMPPFESLPPAPMLARAEGPPLVDLRQGAFARPRAWWRERWTRRALAAGVAAVLVLGVALAWMAATQQARRDDAHDRATRELALRALGQEHATAEQAARALAAARRRAEGAALGPRLALAAEAVFAERGAALGAVELLTDGRLRLALMGPADSVNRVAGRLAGSAFALDREGAAVLLAPPAAPTAPGAVSQAEARYRGAQADAQRLGQRATGAPAPGPPLAALEAALADRALDGRPILLPAGNVALLLAEVRSTIALPLVAELESGGQRFERLSILPGRDPQLRLDLVLAPGEAR